MAEQSNLVIGRLRHRSYDVESEDVSHQIYPERIDPRWLETYKMGDNPWANPDRVLEPLPEGTPTRGDWTGDRPKAWRTDLRLGLRTLRQDVVRQIADEAQSREDFHDYNVIMEKPNWGHCLCALRIISGTKCAEHYRKGEDGQTVETGNQHWAWQIDIAPNRILCPIVKHNALVNGRDYKGCEGVLTKIPPASWVLEQHPEDPVGAIAGRIATDDFRTDEKCPRCQGKSVSESNELLESQEHKAIFWGEVHDPQFSETWPKDHYLQPVMYKPEDWITQYPTLEPGKLYALNQLKQTYSIAPTEIWIPDEGISLAEFEHKQAQAEQALADEARRASERALQIEAEKSTAEAAEEYVNKQYEGQQWH